MSDGLEMETESAAAAVGTIYAAGQTFGAAWTGLHASIVAAETKVGQGLDDLSIAFRESYNASAAPVETAAADVQQIYQGFGDAGAKIAMLYEQADQNAAARLRSSG